MVGVSSLGRLYIDSGGPEFRLSGQDVILHQLDYWQFLGLDILDALPHVLVSA